MDSRSSTPTPYAQCRRGDVSPSPVAGCASLLHRAGARIVGRLALGRFARQPDVSAETIQSRVERRMGAWPAGGLQARCRLIHAAENGDNLAASLRSRLAGARQIVKLLHL